MKIPVLDYANDVKDLNKSGQIVLDAMREPGFLFVKNIPGYQPKTLLQHCKWIFKEANDNVREQLKPNPYRGLIPADPQAESSYKSLYEIGAFEQDRSKEFLVMDGTPYPKDNPEFKEFLQNYYKLMTDVGANIIRMLATARGADPESWVSAFVPNDFSTLRLIHYPQRQGAPPEGLKSGDTVLHCQPHSDGSFLTLLATFHQKGLQMLSETGEYVDVEAEEDGLFINIGELMVHFCGGNVRATRHQVVDHGVERFSVPFFLEPRWDVEVDVGKYGKKKYGIWAVEKMTMFFEHKHLLEQLKKIPEYANSKPITVSLED